LKFKAFRVPQYNAHYEGCYDDRALLWRRLCAADKARNLARLLGARPAVSVLEVGCETGAVLAAVAERGIGTRHVGVDLADPALHRHSTAAGFDLYQFDGNTLPFESASFDLVYASHVIEHVPEPRSTLAEMARVARNWVYVEVPCELHLRTTHRALQQSLDIGHISAYTPESFQLLLETSGLKVVEIDVFDHSYAVHRFSSGVIAAGLKTGIRGALLATGPKLASRVFTYHCGALVTR
jgi:ubiquinone/menaquinone biosynthesis C-methylase UbiE